MCIEACEDIWEINIELSENSAWSNYWTPYHSDILIGSIIGRHGYLSHM